MNATMHRKERTAALHKAFDTMPKDKALEHAITKLGYTRSGALSWFSWWTPKTEKAPKVSKVKKEKVAPVAEVSAPVEKVEAPKVDAKDEKPWVALGISKTTYYRRRKKGELATV